MSYKKIKIAFVIDKVASKIGGTERQILLLMKHLDRNRFDPYLCFFKDDGNNIVKNNWKVYYFDFISYLSPKSYYGLFKFVKFLKKEKIEIIQTFFIDGNILGIIAAKLAKIKIIISTRRNQGYWQSYKTVILYRLLNLFVSKFLVNSMAIKNYIHQVEKIPLSQIDVIYNAYELPEFNNKIQKMFRKREYYKVFSIEKSSYIVVMVANLRYIKGIDVFLKAISIVIKKIENIKFLIIGDGPDKEKLNNLVSELGIKKYVKFLGFRKDINDILNISDIGVLSSHSEGLSNSIIEYLGNGLPVIATNVGGNKELVNDGINGYLVNDGDYIELADKIIELLKDGEKRDFMGKNSRSKAMKLFTHIRIIKMLEEYYISIYKSTN